MHDGGERTTVRGLVVARDWARLREAVLQETVPTIVDLLLDLPKAERALAFRALPRAIAADVFAQLDIDQEDALLRDLTDQETRELLAEMDPDDRTQLLAELPGPATQRMLNLLDAEDLLEARDLLGYPEQSVGRLMTPDYVAVKPEWSVAEALRHIREQGRDSETLDRIYVVDDDWHLLDDIELRYFILADPGRAVRDIMNHTYAFLSAFADRETAVDLIRRYDVLALPVVDSDGVLVGIVTVDDILHVAEQEATEDFHRLGSVEPIRGSLREARLRTLYRRRIGWLLALVFVNLLSGAVIARYEVLIQEVVALVFFLPLLVASAGNAGSQAATLMIRALATGDVRAKDWFRLLGREVAVAGALGGTMALAIALIGMVRGGIEVAAVVAATMVLVVLIGSLVGMSLPFLLARLRLDPATASAPLVTSMADISGVLVYLGIASWILGS